VPLIIDEAVELAVDSDRTWEVLGDPDTIVDCLPGVELLATNPDDSYEGTLTVQFGPTIAIFKGTARVEMLDDLRQSEITARGSDKRGTNRATATMTISVIPVGDSSRIDIAGHVAMVGPLRGFVETGGASIVRALLLEFGERLEAKVKATIDGPTDLDRRSVPISGFRIIWTAIWSTVRDLARKVVRTREP
jgi:carbon monoxide dehydrogenase subunit G